MRNLFVIFALLFISLCSAVFSVEKGPQNEVTSTIEVHASELLNQLEQGESLHEIFSEGFDHFSGEKHYCCYGANGPSAECRKNARSRFSCERKKGCQWMC